MVIVFAAEAPDDLRGLYDLLPNAFLPARALAHVEGLRRQCLAWLTSLGAAPAATPSARACAPSATGGGEVLAPAAAAPALRSADWHPSGQSNLASTLRTMPCHCSTSLAVKN
jgi:hypothetical protein